MDPNQNNIVPPAAAPAPNATPIPATPVSSEMSNPAMTPTPSAAPTPAMAPAAPAEPMQSFAPSQEPIAPAPVEPAPLASEQNTLDPLASAPAMAPQPAAPISAGAQPMPQGMGMSGVNTMATEPTPEDAAPALENPFTQPITSATPPARAYKDLPANNFFATAPAGSAIPQAEATAMQTEAMQAQAQAPAQAPIASAPTEGKKSKLPLIIILAVVVLLGLGVGAFFLLPKLFGDSKSDAKALFIREKEKEGNYALFSLEDGKQLTEFIYQEVSPFSAGYAYVKDKDGKNIIINSKAKTTVKADKYSNFTRCGSAFIAEKDSKYSLILGDGKTLTELASDPYAEDSKVLACGENGQFAYTADGKTYIYSAKGEQLLEHDGSLNSYDEGSSGSAIMYNDSSKKEEDESKLSDAEKVKGNMLFEEDEKHFVIVGDSFILLSDDGLKVEYEYAAKSDYEIYSVSKDGSAIIFEKADDDASGERVIGQNGKVFDNFDKDFEECEYPRTMDSEGGAFFECSDGDIGVILDVEGKKTIANEGLDIVVLDKEHYAILSKDRKEVTFYVNGEKGKTIKGERLDISKNEDVLAYIVTDSKAKVTNQPMEIEEEWDSDYDYNMDYYSLTTYEPFAAYAYSPEGESLLEIKEEGVERISYYGNSLALVYFKEKSDIPNGDFGPEQISLSMGTGKLYKDGKVLPIGDVNVFTKLSDEYYIVGNVNFEKIMTLVFSFIMSAQGEGMDEEAMEAALAEKLGDIDFDRLGIIDQNGESVASPDDYDAMGLDIEGLEMLGGLMGGDTNGLSAGDLALSFRRKDKNGYDTFVGGRKIINSPNKALSSGDFFMIRGESATDFYLMDGTKFYTRNN